jgi:hypothetical protein
MGTSDLIPHLKAGMTIDAASPLHVVMHHSSQEALRITAGTIRVV